LKDNLFVMFSPPNPVVGTQDVMGKGQIYVLLHPMVNKVAILSEKCFGVSESEACSLYSTISLSTIVLGAGKV